MRAEERNARKILPEQEAEKSKLTRYPALKGTHMLVCDRVF